MQHKTHQAVRFEIMEQTRDSISNWIEYAELGLHDYLFKSRFSSSGHLSTRQYARIVGGWVSEIGLEAAEYGTHSMRRTKASLIYRRTKNLRAVQGILNGARALISHLPERIPAAISIEWYANGRVKLSPLKHARIRLLWLCQYLNIPTLDNPTRNLCKKYDKACLKVGSGGITAVSHT